MLSDFLSLELYYDSPYCALFFEELSRQYGPESIRRALRDGDIAQRPLVLGPDQGRSVFWLTDQGRRKAMDGVG